MAAFLTRREWDPLWQPPDDGSESEGLTQQLWNKERIRRSLANTLPAFYDTVIFVCLGINIAALVSAATSESQYEAGSSSLVSILTLYCQNISTLDVIYSYKEPESHPKILIHSYALIFNSCLSLTTAVLSIFLVRIRISKKTADRPLSNLRRWEDVCINQLSPMFSIGLDISQMYLVSLCLYWTFVISGLPIGRKSEERKLKRALVRNSTRPAIRRLASVQLRTSDSWRFPIWYLIFGLVTTSALYILQRSMVQQWSGPAAAENRWSFGQVVTIAAWSNILVEFFYQMKCKQRSTVDSIPILTFVCYSWHEERLRAEAAETVLRECRQTYFMDR